MNYNPIGFAKKLWPLNRSIISKGTRETLQLIKEVCPYLKILNFKSGTKVFDWVIPNEWIINDAYIIKPDNKKICDFKKNNLHVIGYSESVNKIISLKNLKKKLYSLPNLPNAIPYLTSYYKKIWGFCISENEKKKLYNGKYRVYINSDFVKGKLSIGELLIKGKSSKEVFLSTYICHPSMANNELSGPVLTTFLCKWLLNKKKTKYSYRIVFLPETIGSITYLKYKYKQLKKKVIAGYNISCVGDDRAVSFLPSRKNNSLSDSAAIKVLENLKIKYKTYNWNERGSDERQYCYPGIDLPIASVMRSKYATYPEYHTSLDTIGRVMSKKGISKSIKIYKTIINLIEKTTFPESLLLCEPYLSKRNAYPTLNRQQKNPGKDLLDVLTWCDGYNPKYEIAKKLNISEKKLDHYLIKLKKMKLISINKTFKKV